MSNRWLGGYTIPLVFYLSIYLSYGINFMFNIAIIVYNYAYLLSFNFFQLYGSRDHVIGLREDKVFLL